MKTNAAGRELIKRFEGLRLAAYRDAVGVLTIGFGHAADDVREGQVITAHQAEAILDVDLDHFERGLEPLVNVPLTENQHAALISFVYNVGLGNFAKSTLRAFLNMSDYEAASRQFARWRFAGGKELRGLIDRRKAERQLFLTP